MTLCVTVTDCLFKFNNLMDITPVYEAFHDKRDSFERDIIIGRFRSFSTVVIFGMSFDSSYSPKDYYSHASILYIIAYRWSNLS